jgi:hypothetical protein
VQKKEEIRGEDPGVCTPDLLLFYIPVILKGCLRVWGYCVVLRVLWHWLAPVPGFPAWF